MRCLYWLMRAQNGEDVPLETVNFSVLKLFIAFSDGFAAEAPEDAAEADPTKPADGSGAAESPKSPASRPG